MSEKDVITYYKEQINRYKRELEWSDQQLLYLAREIKKREKCDMDIYIRERSKEYRVRQKIRKNIKKYEKLLSNGVQLGGKHMTQKEITTAKKKAKECIELFDIKVPMTKMHILYFYIFDTGCFIIMFKDVRTDDIIQCQCVNNRYTVCKHIKSTGKTSRFLVLKKGEK